MKVKSMNSHLVASKKETLAASKAAASATNKSEKMKKPHNLLLKWVTKLEK
jgi:hypothetical protein